MTLAALALVALQSSPAYAVERETSECRLGGTPSQATALAKNPTFNGWVVVGQSWGVSDSPPKGVPVLDLAAAQAAWDANPGLSFRTGGGDAVGTLPATDPGPDPLPIAGLDPTIGRQLRFRVRWRAVWCPSADDAQDIVAAVYGFRRPPFATTARWAAVDLCLTGWGPSVVSATWPKP